MALIWNFDGSGPNPPPGQIFTASLGTAVVFSAGLAVAYTGLALANPTTPAGKVGIKVIPLRVTFAPTVSGGGTTAWGMVKLTTNGTASNGGVSAFSGAVFQIGVKGTCATNGTSPIGVGTSAVQIGGTFSVINGTAAGTGSNTLYWQEMLGGMGFGTNPHFPTELGGYYSAMPGETLAISPHVAGTGLASITWIEVPLNSGA